MKKDHIEAIEDEIDFRFDKALREGMSFQMAWKYASDFDFEEFINRLQ